MDLQDRMAHRLLRVVLVFHGEPLEERTFPLEETRWPGRTRPTTVTLGQEAHDSFTIPAGPLPPSFPLLRSVGGEFVLRLSEGMVGQLCLSGETMPVQEFFSHRRGIAVSSPESEVSAVVLREHVLLPSDWGIVATEPTGAVAFFFQIQQQQRDLRPRSAPMGSFLPGLPFQVDRFLVQGLALALALTGLILGPALVGWEPDDSLALTTPLPLRLVRLLPPELPGQGPQPTLERRAARQGLAEKLVAEHLQPREQDRRPLLSDDPAAQSPLTLEQQVPARPPQPAAVEQPADPAPLQTGEVAQPALATQPGPPAPLTQQAPPPSPPAAPESPAPPPRPDASSPPSPLPSGEAARGAGGEGRRSPAAAVPPHPTPAASASPQPEAEAATAAERLSVITTPAPASGRGEPAAPAAPGAREAPPVPPQASVQPPPPPAQPSPQRHGPEVISGAPASPGPLTSVQLDQTVSRHQDELTSCYRQELQRQPGLSGRLVLVWNIDATGTVSRVNISNSSLHNSALEACVAHAVQSWRFPAARGLTLGATVPLVFRD